MVASKEDFQKERYLALLRIEMSSSDGCFCCKETITNQNLQGRLSLGDGSIYDGMWRFGKRSGLGTLYFRNGDVFQGSWRDDVMHGKVSPILFWSLHHTFYLSVIESI